MRGVLILLLLSVFAAPLYAADPLPPMEGWYYSPDQPPGGAVLIGHFSESWLGGLEGQVGNTINAQSWDGAALGTQWRVTCPSIAAPPTLVADNRDGSGSGEVIWQTQYTGGRLWFSRFGPWSADNLVDFTGDVVSFSLTSSHLYFLGTLQQVRGNLVMNCIFDQQYSTWDPQCMEYNINNTSIFGAGDLTVLPPEFPPFMDPVTCEGTQVAGAWGDADHISLVITGCTVPVETTTWGRIKTQYTD